MLLQRKFVCRFSFEETNKIISRASRNTYMQLDLTIKIDVIYNIQVNYANELFSQTILFLSRHGTLLPKFSTSPSRRFPIQILFNKFLTYKNL